MRLITSVVFSCALVSAGCSDDPSPHDASTADADVVDDDAAADASPRDVEAPSADDAAPVEVDSASDDDAHTAGDVALSFSVLTYNVAGLPEAISGSMPTVNTVQISPRLNAFDLVAVQEDFAYHTDLISMVEHMFKTAPAVGAQSLGDGLNVLSRFELGAEERVAWEECYGFLDSGSDCLTPKGFMRVPVTLAPGVEVDVYDVHMDAGNTPNDLPVRADNFRQLRAAIAEKSAGKALIVLGDFNERYGAPSTNLQTLLSEAELTDPWATLVTAGEIPMPNDERARCPPDDPNDATCERIDKILLRGSADFTFVPTAYTVEGVRFERDDGEQLSDHRPVSIALDVILSGG